MSLFLMRAGMRTGNGRLYYSGLEYASLFTFPNGHKNYQLSTTFELYLLKVAPPEVRDFIFTFLFYENRTHKDSDSCGEGLDYRLEEYNKKFKLYLHFLFPNFDYWITVCSNTSVLDKMDQAQKLDYGTARSSSEVTAPDYNSRVEHCRTQVRSLQYFDPTMKSSLFNLQSKKAPVRSLDLVTECQEKRREFLNNIVHVKSFCKAPNPSFDNKDSLLNCK